MQIGIDSFAAAYDDASLAVSASDRLRNLVEQIEFADQVGLDVFGIANTTVGSTSIPRRRSFSERRRRRQLLCSVMLVAAVSVHIKKGFFITNGGFEYTLVLGVAAFTPAFTGPESLSLD